MNPTQRSIYKTVIALLVLILAAALGVCIDSQNNELMAWIMYGTFIMCLFIGFIALERALKDGGLK